MKLSFLSMVSIIIVGAVFLSCKKYLDVKPDDSLVSPKTIEDAQALLDNSNVMNQVSTPSYGEASADDYYLTTSPANESAELRTYTWAPFENYIANDWSAGYLAIYYSNLALETVNKNPKTSENAKAWNNVYGSALFFRSYYFLNLAWTFAKSYDENTSNSDLGIALRLQSDPNIKSTRASVKESYTQIVKDAKEAIDYLPTTPTHSFRPSKAAGYGLLARCYLSMRQYDSAYKYSDLCLQINPSLINYNDTATSAPDRIYINVGAYYNSRLPSFTRFNKETIFYTEINKTIPGVLLTDAGSKIDRVTIGYDLADLRYNAFIVPQAATPASFRGRFKGSYAQNISVFFSGIASDEMYLIKAECMARGINGNPGNSVASMTVLNTLLYKRYKTGFGGISATDATDALNKILLERRKELLMRGLRWMDIKRLNKEGRNIVLTRIHPITGGTITLQPNANFYALPLPTDLIIQSGMPQNPL